MQTCAGQVLHTSKKRLLILIILPRLWLQHLRATGLHPEPLHACLCAMGRLARESASWCCLLSFGQHSYLWEVGSSVYESLQHNIVKSDFSWH